MTTSGKQLTIPILIMGVGVGWLLNALGALPGVNWAWTLGLGMGGIAILACGWDKLTVVMGPFLLITSSLSVARQTGNLSIDIEVPALVIVLGALLFLVQMLPVPAPNWLLEEASDSGD